MSTKTLQTLDFSILQQCMHCGMCLPACPTYQETKLERHSPRGRIALMRAIAEDRLVLTEVFHEEMNYCLGCLACETACPAGVDYNQLLEVSRAEAERESLLRSPFRAWVRKFLLGSLFSDQNYLRIVGYGLGIYQKLGLQKLFRQWGFFRLLPRNLQVWEAKTPAISFPFSSSLLREWEHPAGGTKYRVGLLTGCVQDLMFAQVNRDTADVLLANGCSIYTPSSQGCCGSLQAHNGEPEWSKRLAAQLIQEFEVRELDAIITNSAGCGSHLKQLHHLFEKETPEYHQAYSFSKKVKDVHEWLVEIGFVPPKLEKQSSPSSCFTYHEACHLCHGQKITQQPRALLKSIADQKFVELPESNQCCGSAGIYNLLQPKTADSLGRRKLEQIHKTQCDTVVTSNPGCLMHLSSLAQKEEKSLEWKHTMTVMAEAYRRQS